MNESRCGGVGCGGGTVGSIGIGITKGGLKFDQDKTRWDLVPLNCTEGVAKVLTFGAAKYAANSWQNVEEERYYSAMMRHYSQMINGEVLDSESGLPHAYHFLCNAYFITWKQLQKEKPC